MFYRFLKPSVTALTKAGRITKKHHSSFGLPLAKANPKHLEKDVVYHTELLQFNYNAFDVKKPHIYDALNSRFLLFVIITPVAMYWPFIMIRWAWKDPVDYGQF